MGQMIRHIEIEYEGGPKDGTIDMDAKLEGNWPAVLDIKVEEAGTVVTYAYHIKHIIEKPGDKARAVYSY